jgi:hypothetical protein
MTERLCDACGHAYGPVVRAVFLLSTTHGAETHSLAAAMPS